MSGCADALKVEQNIESGRVEVTAPMVVEPPQAALFRGGDRAVVAHALSGSFAAVVTDDAVLLGRLRQLGVSVTVPAALIVAVGRKRKLPAAEVEKLLDALAPYISQDEYTTYKLLLEGRYPRK